MFASNRSVAKPEQSVEKRGKLLCPPLLRQLRLLSKVLKDYKIIDLGVPRVG